MPRARRTGRGPAALACAAALALAGCEADLGSQVAAAVSGERITYADLDRYGASLALEQAAEEGNGAANPQQEQLQRLNLLRELIDQRLLLQKANALGLAVADREVDALIERRELPYGSPEAFHESLAARNLSLDEFRAELRRQLLVEKLLNREVASRVRVSEDELRAYYDRNQSAFTLPEQHLHLAQILVAEGTVSPIPNLRNDDATDLKAARRKIQRIHAELAEGADFGQLARHYSEDPVHAANGGDMGFIPQSAMEKADVRLRRALVALEPGRFSRVIETDGEFRILRLIAIEPAGQRGFDDEGVRRSIRKLLANRKEQLLRLAFYEVERNRAEIRNHLAERIAGGTGE